MTGPDLTVSANSTDLTILTRRNIFGAFFFATLDRFTAGKLSLLKTQPAQSQAERKITGRNKKQKTRNRRERRLRVSRWLKGLEPSTFGATIRCSSQLSYNHRREKFEGSGPKRRARFRRSHRQRNHSNRYSRSVKGRFPKISFFYSAPQKPPKKPFPSFPRFSSLTPSDFYSARRAPFRTRRETAFSSLSAKFSYFFRSPYSSIPLFPFFFRFVSVKSKKTV